jgi:dienelactone hydrolase
MSNLMYIIIITIGLVFLLVCMFIRMRRVKKAVCILASAGLTAAVLRMGDIHFVLDTIVRLTAAEASINEGVFQRIDPTQIGVMGHSLGGSAALGIGRSRADIGAVVALESPFMADVVGLRAGGFDFLDDEYPVPLLHIYTDASWHILSSSPQYAQNHRMLKEGRPSRRDHAL